MTQSAADIFTQHHGNGGGANKIVVGMWRADRVVVDLDRREVDLVEGLVGTNFRNNGANQLTVPLGLRVHKRIGLISQSNANSVSRNGLPCRRSHVDVQQVVEDVVNTLRRKLQGLRVNLPSDSTSGVDPS